MFYAHSTFELVIKLAHRSLAQSMQESNNKFQKVKISSHRGNYGTSSYQRECNLQRETG
jgi:hypothetical protein